MKGRTMSQYMAGSVRWHLQVKRKMTELITVDFDLAAIVDVIDVRNPD